MLRERFCAFMSNRWLVFVAAMWIQSCAGIGYLFGSISPMIKCSLNYNQRQIANLGVAKDLGDSVGFLAGSLCEVLPLWGALLVGALQNLVRYGWVGVDCYQKSSAFAFVGYKYQSQSHK